MAGQEWTKRPKFTAVFAKNKVCNLFHLVLNSPLTKYQSPHQVPFFGPSKAGKGCNLIFVETAANFGLLVNSSKFTFEPSTLEPKRRPSLLEPCHFNNTSAFENYWWKGVRSCKLSRTCRFYNLVIWTLSSGKKRPLRERGF